MLIQDRELTLDGYDDVNPTLCHNDIQCDSSNSQAFNQVKIQKSELKRH